MFENVVCGAIALIILFLIFKIISLPVKLIFKVLINTLCGLVILFVIDVLSVYTGIWIEPTFLNAAITGILGLPGIGFLLAANWLL